ncbi:MAG: radical SAM protein [Candidatus Methanomethylicaceae archaeon]|nr:radical SAM protein [Candidatus Verstraetearchaeota archaeon]
MKFKESKFYEKLNNKVKCKLCEHKCIIDINEYGLCKTRKNIDGKLYTIVYGALSAIESRPIEIKPFFHYWPGSTALTFSTWSCNFNCPWCQNWTLSKLIGELNYYSPEEIIEIAIRNKDEGLCSSFQEPTLLTDWNIELFKISKKYGLYSCYVSNGYMTLEVLKELYESGMDGLKIDIKGDKEVYEKYCGGIDYNKIWRNVREAKKIGYHIELVNLIITNLNDNEECIREIVERTLKEVGFEVPIHFTRYFPAYEFKNPPTEIKKLELAYKIAKNMGMLYVYIGNVPGHRYENTYCPNCGEILIKRYSYKVLEYRIEKNKCPKCRFEINIRGNYIKK